MDEMQIAQSKLQEGPYLKGTDFYIVDVRDMLDEPQPLETYIYMISRAITTLNKHKKIVICCGAGQSRSNAIAIGVLMEKYKMNFYDAYSLIREKVPITLIEPCHLSALKEIYDVGPP
jgi:protein-tyrosine phosphatase